MWRDGRYALPAFPSGTRFSPAARDFIKDHQLEIRFADPTPSAIPSPQLPTPAPDAGAGVTNYQLPSSLDALHALVLLSAAEARRYQLPALALHLDALAAHCFELLAAERGGQPPVPLRAPLPPPQALAKAPAVLSPGATDHAIVHWLNLVRAAAGQAAAQAQAAGAASEANASLAAGLCQVGAAAADLGRRVQSGELGWNSAMV